MPFKMEKICIYNKKTLFYIKNIYLRSFSYKSQEERGAYRMIHWTEGIGKKRKKWTMGCILLSILLCFGAPVSFFARLPEKTAGQARAAEAAKDLTPSVDTVISSVGAYMLSIDTNPDYNSIWNVIGLTRSGISVPASYTDTFYKNVYAYLEQKEWVLTKSKYSDYSKLILGLTAIGKDAQNVGGGITSWLIYQILPM